MANEVVQMLAQGAQALRQVMQDRSRIMAQTQMMAMRFSEQQDAMDAREKKLKAEQDLLDMRQEEFKLKQSIQERQLQLMPSVEQAGAERAEALKAQKLSNKAAEEELKRLRAGTKPEETASMVLARLRQRDQQIEQRLDIISHQRDKLPGFERPPDQRTDDYLRYSPYERLEKDYEIAQQGLNKMLATPAAPGQMGQEQQRAIAQKREMVEYMRAELAYRNRALASIYTQEGNPALGRVHAQVSANLNQAASPLGDGGEVRPKAILSTAFPELEVDLRAALQNDDNAAYVTVMNKAFGILRSRGIELDPGLAEDREKVRNFLQDVYQENTR